MYVDLFFILSKVPKTTICLYKPNPKHSPSGFYMNFGQTSILAYLI